LNKSKRAVCLFAINLIGFAICDGCGGVPPTVVTQPTNETVMAGQTATFSVVASGPGRLRYRWERGGEPIPGANGASYTTGATTIADGDSQFSVVVSNGAGRTTSSAATLTVVPATTDVLTCHNDNGRTGKDLAEALLTTGNVRATTFGKIAFYATDGLVDAEPLYVSNVAIPNQGTHQLLIVATENGSVYALDADSGASMWQVSTLETGESPSDDPGCPTCAEIGVNATPVIDRTMGGHGAVYVVADSKDSSGNYHQRLHALDLTTGSELFGGPVEIQASYPGTGDDSDGSNVIFDPRQYRERAALLLLNGVIYTSWASHWDNRPYTGWIIAYSASTLAQTAVLNVTPNGSQGAIWMSGAGLAADNAGNIYFADANGDFDETMDSRGFPAHGDYGNAFLKLSTSGGLGVADYFEMENYAAEDIGDVDLGSGGAMVLPDLNDGSGHTLHLAVAAGKDSNVYVVNRDAMGKSSANDVNIYQELVGALPGGVWGMPAYFKNTVYYAAQSGPIQAFTFNNGKLSSNSVAQSVNSYAYPGAALSVSANGTSNGIIWAVQTATAAGSLHAYDASNLQELYNSDQMGSRDQFAWGSKFVPPMIANGKVFVATFTGVAVFGPLR
jgi:hypothetical protein